MSEAVVTPAWIDDDGDLFDYRTGVMLGQATEAQLDASGEEADLDTGVFQAELTPSQAAMLLALQL